MNTKIQELTEKIYQEGVEKGKLDAGKLLSDAQKESEKIIDEANKKARQILDDAQKESLLLKKNTEAELKLFTRQMVDALKIEIADLIAGSIADDSVKAAVADKKFMQQVILEFVKAWGKTQGVSIQTENVSALSDYFEKNAKDLLNKGIRIEEVNNIKTDFQIVSKEDGYKIEFGEAEFVAYFKEFLRPKLLEILF